MYNKITYILDIRKIANYCPLPRRQKVFPSAASQEKVPVQGVNNPAASFYIYYDVTFLIDSVRLI